MTAVDAITWGGIEVEVLGSHFYICGTISSWK